MKLAEEVRALVAKISGEVVLDLDTRGLEEYGVLR